MFAKLMGCLNIIDGTTNAKKYVANTIVPSIRATQMFCSRMITKAAFE
jgi:hypothetical protein